MSYQQPQPSKTNTGLIAALVALVLVIAGVGIALVVTLSGNDNDDKGSDDNTSSEPSSDSTPSPSESPSTPSPTQDGPAVTGQDYSYALPDGWSDVSDDPKAAAAPTIDTVSAWGESLTGSRANVIVEAGSAMGATDPEQAREKWKATMEAAVSSKGVEIPDITIAGKKAIGYKFETTNAGGVEIVQYAYYAINGSIAHSIALSAPENDADAARSAFDKMLASWTWTQ